MVSESVSWPVSMMIGALKPFLRRMRTASRPSMSGRPTSMMTRSIWPALAACTPLVPESTATASNSSCRASCSTRAVAQLRIIVDDQDFAGVGHRIPGLPRGICPGGFARSRAFGSKRASTLQPMGKSSLHTILVRATPRRAAAAAGWSPGRWRLPVALGRGGIRANKREGDGGTPRGTFRLRRLWWRADRLPRPRTRLPVRRIRPDDGWCEDPPDRHYNQPVRLPANHPGDRLWRDDRLYDLIIELDHNTRPAHRRPRQRGVRPCGTAGLCADRRMRRAQNRCAATVACPYRPADADRDRLNYRDFSRSTIV